MITTWYLKNWIDIQWKPWRKAFGTKAWSHEGLAAKHKAFWWHRDDIPCTTLYFRRFVRPFCNISRHVSRFGGRRGPVKFESRVSWFFSLPVAKHFAPGSRQMICLLWALGCSIEMQPCRWNREKLCRLVIVPTTGRIHGATRTIKRKSGHGGR